jgi:hypothetical protein
MPVKITLAGIYLQVTVHFGHIHYTKLLSSELMMMLVIFTAR